MIPEVSIAPDWPDEENVILRTGIGRIVLLE
jgi:hypothetical protein